MKKILFVLLSLFIVTGCKGNDVIKTKEGDDMISINVVINDVDYTLNLENNETVQDFLKLLPVQFDMKELNGNEKYAYLDSPLSTDSYNPGVINKGDVMLFGNDCLVIFYESFNTSYSYTKIGHIDNLPDLGSESVSVKFRN